MLEKNSQITPSFDLVAPLSLFLTRTADKNAPENRQSRLELAPGEVLLRGRGGCHVFQEQGGPSYPVCLAHCAQSPE